MQCYEQLKLENQLCFPLYAAARKVVGKYTPFLKPLGLTYTQYIVMMVLWERKEVTVGEICRLLYLDNGTVTPLLKKLEAAGLVTRRRGTEDERVVTVRASQAGMALQEQAKEVPMQIGQCLGIDPETAGQLYGLLYRVLEA